MYSKRGKIDQSIKLQVLLSMCKMAWVGNWIIGGRLKDKAISEVHLFSVLDANKSNLSTS